LTIFIEIGFWVGLVGFLFLANITWLRISQHDIAFRSRFLLLTGLLIWTDGAFLYVAPGLPAVSAETIYQIALFFAVIGTLILFSVYRKRYKAQFLPKNDFQTLAAVYVAQNLHVAYMISDLISNVSQIHKAVSFPNHHRSLNTLIGIMKKVFLKNINGVELMISILETRPEGKFEVTYTSDNISLTTETQMEEHLRWKKPIKGIAGLCAASYKAVLCTDLTKEKLSAVRYWVNITGQREGGILCVPIAYPPNLFDGDEGQIGRCFGVLCISASKTNFLQDYHREWIEVILIKSLANLLLIHRLHDRMYLE